jgi:hypothetical protein
MADKPPFKLTITLEAFKPEAMNMALDEINELCNHYDQAGELKTKVTIESWKEDPLLSIRAEIEDFLRRHKVAIDGKVSLESPLMRTIAQETPIEAAIRKLTPKPGDGVDAVELSAGGRTVRLVP